MEISSVLQPLINLIRNRTFVTALVGAIVAVAVGLIPTLTPYQTQIVSVVVALVLLSAGGEIVTSTAATVSTAKVEAAKAEAAAPVGQLAMVQGESLKPFFSAGDVDTINQLIDIRVKAILATTKPLA